MPTKLNPTEELKFQTETMRRRLNSLLTDLDELMSDRPRSDREFSKLIGDAAIRVAVFVTDPLAVPFLMACMKADPLWARMNGNDEEEMGGSEE